MFGLELHELVVYGSLLSAVVSLLVVIVTVALVEESEDPRFFDWKSKVRAIIVMFKKAKDDITKMFFRRP